MKELGVELIFAHSAPPKGRIERSNQTMQDRLVKELRLRGISTPEAYTIVVKSPDLSSRAWYPEKHYTDDGVPLKLRLKKKEEGTHLSDEP